jgi:hypothetical protein
VSPMALLELFPSRHGRPQYSPILELLLPVTPARSDQSPLGQAMEVKLWDESVHFPSPVWRGNTWFPMTRGQCTVMVPLPDVVCSIVLWTDV